MPTANRPTAVTVLAILNFVVGGLGLFGIFCGGLSILVLAAMAPNMPAPPGGGPNPLVEMGELFKSIPGYIPFMIITSILGVAMAVLLIVAGIGLLRMRRWARTACLVYAVYTIIATLVGSVYTFTVVQPATNQWNADFQARLQRGPAPGAAAPAASNIGGTVGTVIGAIFGMAYAVTLLIVLNLPTVSAAFYRSGTAGSGLDYDEDERFRNRETGY